MIDIVSIQFKKTATEPFYQTLAHAIKKQIKREDVPEGERLPAIRTVAERFDLNNATVIAAYRLLEEKGLVYTKQGSGTYTLPAIAPPPKDELTHLFGEYAAYNSQKFTQADGMIDLAGNSPTASIFPVKEFKEAVNAVLDADGGYAFSYQESEGYYPLREILAVFSSVQYGIHCTPEETLITAGAQQALDLISKAILKPGDTVFAEMPSYIGMRSVFALHDARLVGIPVENDGINLNLVAYYAKKYKPRLLYTMPVYQTPT
ncbi:MAG TPA: PLP-dependent aminotransferase family protein, partial [Ruminococcaceae bacterium]|nr:PLP-dependent aminotransferase family protein [Oscillospiraceae bacterium]